MGRNRGHEFEKLLARAISAISLDGLSTSDASSLNAGLVREPVGSAAANKHLFVGDPSTHVLRYVLLKKGFSIQQVRGIQAHWLGGLATSRQGDLVLDANGARVRKSKSDILIELDIAGSIERIGLSVKTCNKDKPTNDQLYCTTARAFCDLLRQNGLTITQATETGLQMFCGDEGFRPRDMSPDLSGRLSDPNRWFFEELPQGARQDLQSLFTRHQKDITEILLRKAYAGDPFPPDFLLHQTVAFTTIESAVFALLTIDELVDYSCRYTGFVLNPYKIRKGSYKGDPNTHLAPRFGFVQFQRLGNKQNATQLQFNLEAGYFLKLPA